MKFPLLLFLILLALSGFSQATEEVIPEHLRLDDGAQFHQLYLDHPARKVISVEYIDGTPIRFELDEDGETVYLIDYYKKGRVKVTYEKQNGQPGEQFRSSCFIDPVIQS